MFHNATPVEMLRTSLRSDPHTTPTEALAALRRLRARLDEEEHLLVFQLRLHHATWDEIAEATGMASRQAAHARFAESVHQQRRPEPFGSCLG